MLRVTRGAHGDLIVDCHKCGVPVRCQSGLRAHSGWVPEPLPDGSLNLWRVLLCKKCAADPDFTPDEFTLGRKDIEELGRLLEG